MRAAQTKTAGSAPTDPPMVHVAAMLQSAWFVLRAAACLEDKEREQRERNCPPAPAVPRSAVPCRAVQRSAAQRSAVPPCRFRGRPPRDRGVLARATRRVSHTRADCIGVGAACARCRQHMLGAMSAESWPGRCCVCSSASSASSVGAVPRACTCTTVLPTARAPASHPRRSRRVFALRSLRSTQCTNHNSAGGAFARPPPIRSQPTASVRSSRAHESPAYTRSTHPPRGPAAGG